MALNNLRAKSWEQRSYSLKSAMRSITATRWRSAIME
jgi:hypothetical protein